MFDIEYESIDIQSHSSDESDGESYQSMSELEDDACENDPSDPSWRPVEDEEVEELEDWESLIAAM